MDLLTSDLNKYIQADKYVELYGHTMNKVKLMLADSFGGKPTTYHDGERRIIVEVTNKIFDKVIQ